MKLKNKSAVHFRCESLLLCLCFSFCGCISAFVVVSFASMSAMAVTPPHWTKPKAARLWNTLWKRRHWFLVPVTATRWEAGGPSLSHLFLATVTDRRGPLLTGLSSTLTDGSDQPYIVLCTLHAGPPASTATVFDKWTDAISTILWLQPKSNSLGHFVIYKCQLQ